MALALIALMGFGALAIDVGMMFLARNELQNAADAAALAAAQEFYYNGCTDCPQSRWTRTEDSARANIAINKSMNGSLSTGTVTTGWWNITGTPGGDAGQDPCPDRRGRRSGRPRYHPESAGQQRRLGSAAARLHVRRPEHPGHPGDRRGRGVVPVDRYAEPVVPDGDQQLHVRRLLGL